MMVRLPLVPEGACVGDMICALKGGCVPFVVRAANEQDGHNRRMALEKEIFKDFDGKISGL